jgi:hypothetical protein
LKKQEKKSSKQDKIPTDVKGGLILESFSFRLKPPKNGCQITTLRIFTLGMGGFQLELVSISWVLSHMTCYKFECSHWWKIHFSKKKYFTRFAHQSEC